MKRVIFATAALIFILVLIVIAVFTVFFAAKPSYASNSIDLLQAGKPTGGWYVCEDYGVGEVPGLSDERPRFHLCHPGGWEVDVYCLNPEMPLPAIDAKCNLINEIQYSCGEGIQLLEEYPLQVTATPTSTATFTSTATDTSTPTQTSTITLTTTPTWTPTASPSPTATSTSSVTPTVTQTSTPTTTSNVTVTSTSTATTTTTSSITTSPTTTQTHTPTATTSASVSPTSPTNTLLPTITSPPTFTPTGTWVIYPTATSTFIPSATPIYPTATPRQQAGGYGFRDLISIFLTWIGLIDSHENTPSPNSAISAASPTPFQPLRHPASTWIGQPGSPPPLDFHGIDFRPGALPINIQIISPETHLNRGKPIEVRFTPGDECNFGDGQACVSAHPGVLDGHTIFITIHSGIGGEAQNLRHALEGTGFDQAAFSLEKVRNKLALLQGAQVVITQGDITIYGLTLEVASRVPAENLQHYFSLPIPQAMRYAGELDPSLASYLPADQPQIVFETCGWKMPGEPWAPGVDATSGSAYLGVIRK